MYKFDELKSTFQDSIFTWDYFTDFKKVKTHIKQMEKELNLLNYLIGKNHIEAEFITLLKEYPQVKKALPLLIAVRADNRAVFRANAYAACIHIDVLICHLYHLSRKQTYARQISNVALTIESSK